MNHETNRLGQPIGFNLPDWTPPPIPAHEMIEGRYCRLEPLQADRHAEALYTANALDRSGGMWTYLPYGPFEDLGSYRAWVEASSRSSDPLFFAIVDRQSDKAVGVTSFMRIEPRHGCIEVGHLCFSPLLQRTPAATEAIYLQIKRAFDLGYRRCEWKCDSLNAPSRAAAQRLGFLFEGIFRQAVVVKGRNRDTAWYAIIDKDWPALQEAFARWLNAANFDLEGRQKTRLSDLTTPETLSSADLSSVWEHK